MMYETAKIVKYEERQEGTYILTFLPDRHLQSEMDRKLMQKCGMWLNDGRKMSAEQRGMIYATMRDISYFTGEHEEYTKAFMKQRHWEQKGYRIDTFRDCSMDDARAFIDTLIEFIIFHGIPLNAKLYERTEFIDRALYYCLKYLKCAICGKYGEIHHVDAIGMGRDRTHYDDGDHRKICLCRIHHTEAHSIGVDSFEQKHHVYGIVFNEESERII